VVEHLPSKLKVLSSNPCTEKKRKVRKEGMAQEKYNKTKIYVQNIFKKHIQ
jgi:hypothetical protein